MKRFFCYVATVLTMIVSLSNCASMNSGWTTLIDGSSLDNWTAIGNANWRVAEGTVMADKGEGFLLTKNSYGDFQIRAEFWVDDKANSGIFIRCTDATKVNSKNSYEVNIFDQRPDTSYGTGAIVDVAKIPNNPYKAGGKWNTYEITAKGDSFTVTLNGVRTVDGARDPRHANGLVALQYAAGVVKFRKFEIRAI